jgi:hypothetical protein
MSGRCVFVDCHCEFTTSGRGNLICYILDCLAEFVHELSEGLKVMDLRWFLVAYFVRGFRVKKSNNEDNLRGLIILYM